MREQLKVAELDGYIEWRLGDAVSLLDDQPGPVDFVFIDLWKDLYVPCFEKMFPKLAKAGVIAADNMLFPPAALDDARRYRGGSIKAGSGSCSVACRKRNRCSDAQG